VLDWINPEERRNVRDSLLLLLESLETLNLIFFFQDGMINFNRDRVLDQGRRRVMGFLNKVIAILVQIATLLENTSLLNLSFATIIVLRGYIGILVYLVGVSRSTLTVAWRLGIEMSDQDYDRVAGRLGLSITEEDLDFRVPAQLTTHDLNWDAVIGKDSEFRLKDPFRERLDRIHNTMARWKPSMLWELGYSGYGGNDIVGVGAFYAVAVAAVLTVVVVVLAILQTYVAFKTLHLAEKGA
jgi:hypothetical protein